MFKKEKIDILQKRKIKSFPFEYEIGKEQLRVYIEELLRKR